MITYLTGLHRELHNLDDQAPVPQGTTTRSILLKKSKIENRLTPLLPFLEFSQKEEQVMNKLDTLQESVDQVERIHASYFNQDTDHPTLFDLSTRSCQSSPHPK
jgi:hypothetical protein